MREFHFRLQSILDVRRYEEDQRRLELGVISSRCATLKREIAARNNLRHRILAEPDPDERAEDVAYRLAQAAYAARLHGEVANLERELHAAETERLGAVERYREARRNADVLSRLRDHRAAAHRRNQLRDEYKQMDEIAMSRRKQHAGTI